MWRDYHDTEFAIENNVLYIKVSHPEAAFAPPLGAPLDPDVGMAEYERIFEYCRERRIPARLCSASEVRLKSILELFPDAASVADRANSDYLYLCEDLKNLPGRKYSGQRNHINRFLREYASWSFERVTASNVSDAAGFVENYSRENVKDSPTYTEGNAKALEVLDNLESYGLLGGMLRVNGSVAGLSIGEIAGDTIFVHTEKADISYMGVYPMLMTQFLKEFTDDSVIYVNREEDDGDEGLRTSKLSYHPVALLDKYTITIDIQPTRDPR
jgi:hypothetical protein